MVHLSGLIGIQLGFQEWFIPKTPMNLLLNFALLCLSFPLNTRRSILMAVVIFITGMAAEWIGVHTGLPFGTYAYGANLGPKMDGVPWLIGTNWVVLTLITAAISTHLVRGSLTRAAVGSALMVAIDFLIEQSAPAFDFWQFEGGVPPWGNVER